MYNKLAAPYITNWQHHGSGLPYNISSSERVKASVKEGGYPTFTPEDMIFLFEEVTHPESMILNHSDPTECYVLFPPLVQLDEIYNLNRDPSWVWGSMALIIRQPPSNILNVVREFSGKQTSGRGGEI